LESDHENVNASETATIDSIPARYVGESACRKPTAKQEELAWEQHQRALEQQVSQQKVLVKLVETQQQQMQRYQEEVRHMLEERS